MSDQRTRARRPRSVPKVPAGIEVDRVPGRGARGRPDVTVREEPPSESEPVPPLPATVQWVIDHPMLTLGIALLCLMAVAAGLHLAFGS